MGSSQQLKYQNKLIYHIKIDKNKFIAFDWNQK